LVISRAGKTYEDFKENQESFSHCSILIKQRVAPDYTFAQKLYLLIGTKPVTIDEDLISSVKDICVEHQGNPEAEKVSEFFEFNSGKEVFACCVH
jgi:hypothetical protein